jgi:hypothetical protein
VSLEKAPDRSLPSQLILIKPDLSQEIVFQGSNTLEYALYSCGIDTQTPVDSQETISQPTPEIHQPPLVPTKDNVAATPLPPSLDWDCPICTFINVISRTRCEICGTDNPTRRDVSDAESDSHIVEANADSAPAVEDYAVWMCAQCTFMNQLESSR